MEHETFWTLMRSTAHWEFELFIQVVGDGLIGLVLWPFFRKKVLHHQSDDQKIEALEQKVKSIQDKLGMEP
jgi:hypothetical protein